MNRYNMTGNWKQRLMKEIHETCKSEGDIHYLIENRYLSVFFYTPREVVRKDLPDLLEFLSYLLTKGQNIKTLINPSPDIPFFIGFQRIKKGKPHKQRKMAIILIETDKNNADSLLVNAYNAYYEIGSLLVGLSNLKHKHKIIGI